MENRRLSSRLDILIRSTVIDVDIKLMVLLVLSQRHMSTTAVSIRRHTVRVDVHSIYNQEPLPVFK